MLRLLAPALALVVACPAASAQVASFAPNTIIEDPSLMPTSEFAATMDAAGSMVVARDRAGSTNPIQVRVYAVSPSGAWVNVQSIVSTVGPSAEFGTSISTDGQVIAVGAPSAAGASGSPTGAVVLFEIDAQSSAWVVKQTLSTGPSKFGNAVRLLGDTLAVRQGKNPNDFMSLPAWRFFKRDMVGTWVDAPTPVPLDKFPVNVEVDTGSSSIAMDGNLLAIGGRVSAGGSSAGRVYIFERNAFGGWLQVDRIERDDHVGFGGFGTAIEIVGDRLFVSAPSSSYTSPVGSGSVHVYDRGSNDDWFESAVVVVPAPQANKGFGYRIDTDGSALFASWGGDTLSFVESTPGTWTPVHEHRNAPGGPAIVDALRVTENRLVFTRRAKFLGGGAIDPVGAVVIHEFVQLTSPTATISASLGGSQSLDIRMGEQWSNSIYFVLGSLSGTSPGMPFVQDQWSFTLPLNFDAYTDLCLMSLAPITGQLGVLDQLGAATPRVVVPAGVDASLVGLQAHHAAIVASPALGLGATNAVPITIGD